MSNSRLAGGAGVPGLAVVGFLVAATAASAQSCEHRTPLVTVCRYVVSTPEALNAEAVGRVRRDGPAPHAELMLRIDGRPCGSGEVSPGFFGHSTARARCVLRPAAVKGGSPIHVAEADFSSLSDAQPLSLEIRLDHRGGLLSLPLEEKALAPRPAHHRWLGLFGR